MLGTCDGAPRRHDLRAGGDGGVSERTYHLPALVEALERCLLHYEAPPEHAARVAEILMDCELRGYDDHGVSFLGSIAGWYRAGALNPKPAVRVLREDRAGILLDGDSGCGAIAATEAMRRCIAAAREHGMAAAGIQRSGHFIAAAPYAAMAAGAGMIGFASSNTPPLMAPSGGLTPTLGTNPMAYAVPAGQHDPVVMDMATSATAGFKVRMAAKEGRTLEEGLITDAEGSPTTDPNDFVNGGLILPAGGYKGYGLAMVVDALAGVLTGAGFALGGGVTKGKCGQFLWALDVELFMPRAEFAARVDHQIDEIKASRKKAGVQEIFVPGERGQRRRRELQASGAVPLNEIGWRVLEDECARAGVPVPETERA